VNVSGFRALALGEQVTLRGPGVLAFDGDRERRLLAGQTASLRIVRDGPHVFDVERTLRLGAERGAFLDRERWHDAYDEH